MPEIPSHLAHESFIDHNHLASDRLASDTPNPRDVEASSRDTPFPAGPQ